MAKVRIFAFVSTLIVVGVIGLFVSYYARGYKFDFKALKFQPNGILVIKSEPDGASVYIDSELKTATNATVSLSPGTYDVEVKKDGYFSWYKRMVIEKEIVTQATVSLFKIAPSLTPITFSGAQNPVISEDGTKIAFTVAVSKDAGSDIAGLYTMDTFSLPLGFSNGPKRITDGDLGSSSYVFSPDGRSILLNTSQGAFILDSGSFVSQDQRINIASKKDTTITGWQKELDAKNASLTRYLPPEVTDILSRKTSSFDFSPDQSMVLYTASGSGTLPDNLIKPLPGASTQKQERVVQGGHTYVYDTKEDRNFLVDDQPVTIDAQLQSTNNSQAGAIRWMPGSRHLLLAETGQAVVMDYDGTNKQVIYSGSYIAPFAFPFTNETKILILTNLGASSSSANLYTLTVK